MDPGNWATDLAGGAQFGYTLLSVVLLSNLMAVLLQSLAVKLGLVTGRDLAQACRDHFSPPVSFALWVLCEIAIAACDLAEVIGSAIALYLHSSIVQTRNVPPDVASRREAIRYATIDSTIALCFAFFINAAILILAAATFHQTGNQTVADIGDAYHLLTPLLGTTFASTLFAVALL